MILFFFFFFKQKTAYEMRISDWSSDVCSSDLRRQSTGRPTGPGRRNCARRCFPLRGGCGVHHGFDTVDQWWPAYVLRSLPFFSTAMSFDAFIPFRPRQTQCHDRGPTVRKSVVSGKSVTVRGDHGGSRNQKK